jgi:hypothetical protein
MRVALGTGIGRGKEGARRVWAAAKGGGGYQCGAGAARRIGVVVAVLWMEEGPVEERGVSPAAKWAARWESLADPLKPYDPASLCNSPIFPDCFTLRRRRSDAFMHS